MTAPWCQLPISASLCRWPQMLNATMYPTPLMPTCDILAFVVLVFLMCESTANNQQFTYYAWKHRMVVVAYDTHVH